jgi:translation initiation factor 3 subunit E
LTGKWEVALEELNLLRETIDSRAASAPVLPSSSHLESRQSLYSRAWLIHWSLFVYFNHSTGRALLLETFLTPTYLNTIQSATPWILRYLSVAAVLARSASSGSGRSRYSLREVVKIVQMEEYQYADPVTRFLNELYVQFDFEAAQRELVLAEAVVADDFFLTNFRDDFLDNARYLISEAYCRIHQRIDIGSVMFYVAIEVYQRIHSDLSTRLNLSPEEGEKWIVNLIRDTRMGADAKIDLEKVCQVVAVALQIHDFLSRMSSKSTAQFCLCINQSSKKHVDYLYVRKRWVPQWSVQGHKLLKPHISGVKIVTECGIE